MFYKTFLSTFKSQTYQLDFVIFISLVKVRFKSFGGGGMRFGSGSVKDVVDLQNQQKDCEYPKPRNLDECENQRNQNDYYLNLVVWLNILVLNVC